MNKNLFMRMMLLDRADVEATYSAYIAKQDANDSKGAATMLAQGYEETVHKGLLTPDGRDIIDLYGKRWALNVEAHAERLKKAQEAAKLRDVSIAASKPETAETKSVAGTDGLAKMACPKCGDALQYSAVCGACAAGRAGYRHRYSCVHGCVDFVSKEKV